MTARTARRGRYALAAIAAMAAIAITVVAFTLPGRPPGRAFPPLHPAAAPAGWPHLTLPNGTAVLSYPPSLHPLAGDTDAVSAARLGPGGAFQLYLNATPRQGSERLQDWAAFRLHAAALRRRGIGAPGRRRAGGQVPRRHRIVRHRRLSSPGSARHHYQEIACLVQGRTSASVIVAAAPAATWAQARPLLFRAVAAYLVR